MINWVIPLTQILAEKQAPEAFWWKTNLTFDTYRFGFQERLFFSLAEELTRTGRANGVITGGRTAAKVHVLHL